MLCVSICETINGSVHHHPKGTDKGLVYIVCFKSELRFVLHILALTSFSMRQYMAGFAKTLILKIESIPTASLQLASSSLHSDTELSFLYIIKNKVPSFV